MHDPSSVPAPGPLRDVGRRLCVHRARGAAALDLRGIYPIVQTPYTKDDAVDFKALEAGQVPTNRRPRHRLAATASQYQYLSFEERIEGAERTPPPTRACGQSL
ncbi:MAG: hypothetical protein R2724_00225 [Bryobacterales bacterium]